MLEKTLECLLNRKEIQPVHPKGNQSWIFIGRTDNEAPILWPCDMKNWLIRKDPDAGKVWREEEKRATEGEMLGWDHRLDGHEFEQDPVVGDGQVSLVCCSPWCHKELIMTKRLNSTGLNWWRLNLVLWKQKSSFEKNPISESQDQLEPDESNESTNCKDSERKIDWVMKERGQSVTSVSTWQLPVTENVVSWVSDIRNWNPTLSHTSHMAQGELVLCGTGWEELLSL